MTSEYYKKYQQQLQKGRRMEYQKPRKGDTADIEQSVLALIQYIEEKERKLQEKEREVQVYYQQLEQKEREEAEKEQEIRRYRHQLQEKDREEAEREERYHNQLQEKDREHQVVLQEKDRELQEKDRELQEKDREHMVVLQEKDKEHQVVLQEKDREHQVVLQEKDREHQVVLQEKNRELQEKDREHQVVLQEKDRKLQEMGREHQMVLQVVLQELQVNQEALQQKDRELQENQEALQQKDRGLQENQEALQQKDRELQENQEALQQKDRELQENQEALQQKDKELQVVLQMNQEALQQKGFVILEKDKELEEKDRELCQSQEAVRRYQQQALTDDHWVINKDEVTLTKEELGRGSYAVVTVGIFRGLRVAVKSLHTIIISDYNLGIFSREMSIALRVRHPNLVQFIGATKVGNPLILTELMITSLHKKLHETNLTNQQILSIAQDVALGLNYLHLFKPQPIIHRDVSSPNVLLKPCTGPAGYEAKITDYGTAKLQQSTSTGTVMPGNPAYAAPEARDPNRHSPAMDVYSYSVLLMEMNLRCPPEMTTEERARQSGSVSWSDMKSLIQRGFKANPRARPTMAQVIESLKKMKI